VYHEGSLRPGAETDPRGPAESERVSSVRRFRNVNVLTVLHAPLYRRAFTIHLCRDLYIVYAINACDNFNYFSLSLLFTLYLTEEFGFTDQEVILPINLVLPSSDRG